jgi:hypothetical protein
LRPPRTQRKVLVTRSVGLVALTALLVVTAACGGGTSETATGTSETTTRNESTTSSTIIQTAGTGPSSSSPVTSSAVGDASTACRYWTAGIAPNKKSVLPASFPKFPAKPFGVLTFTFCHGRTSPQKRDEYAGIATPPSDPARVANSAATVYQALLRASGCVDRWGSERRGIYGTPDRVSIYFECGGQRGQFVALRTKPVFWITVA